MCVQGRARRARVFGVGALVVAVALVAVPACSNGQPDAPRAAEEAWSRPRAADGGMPAVELSVDRARSGRFSIRLERGLVGVAELDATVRGAFDRRVPAVELVADLDEFAAPTEVWGAMSRSAGTRGTLTIRQVAGEVYVRAPGTALEWVVLPPGSVVDPFELASLQDPARLVDLVERTATLEERSDGGVVDEVSTERRSGTLSGSAVAELAGASDLAALAASVPAELLAALLRFDLWVGVDDGLPRRLVIEWNLPALAELARRLDGTDEGIDRLRYRTEVSWTDLDEAVSIEVPPPDRTGVVDLDALARDGLIGIPE